MASVKSTFLMLVLVLVLAGLGVGGAVAVQWWKARGIQQDLVLAEQALQQQRPTDAEQILTRLLDQAKPGTSWTPQALALRFRALDAIQDATVAQALATRVLDAEKPWAPAGSEAWGRAHVVLARAALAANQPAQARPHLEAVLAQSATPGLETVKANAEIDLARIDMAEMKVEAGRDRLLALLDTLPADSPARGDAEHILGVANVQMLLSPQPFGADQIHVLAKGDSPDKIARKFKISTDLLMGINKISDPKKLRIGRRMKIPDVDFSIVVNKSDNTLVLYNHGKFFKRYRVRTGKLDFMTPPGDYTIENKSKDPAWYNVQTNTKIAPGDPANELGSRWMGFQGTSLGLHEAIDPSTVGFYGSNGCVGLTKADIEEIYDMVPVGTPVKIVGALNPALMAASGGGSAPAAGGAIAPLPGQTPAVAAPVASPTPAAAPAVALP